MNTVNILLINLIILLFPLVINLFYFAHNENIDKEIGNSAINEWLFNANTIDLVLNKLMSEGLRVEGEEKLLCA